MKILLICEEYPPSLHGGIGTFTRLLSEQLANCGHFVVVAGVYSRNLYTNFSENSEVQNGVLIYRFPEFSKLKFKRVKKIVERFFLTKKIRELHKIHQFDIIECHDSGGWLALGRLPDIPKIIRLHGSQIYFDNELKRNTGKLNKILERIWIKRANFIISVSKYVAEKTLNLMGNHREYSIIYNSVDTNKFCSQKRIPIEKGLILFTGTVIPKKGVLELLKAFELIIEKYPQAHLLIVGKDIHKTSKGELYSKYLQTLISNDANSRVRFLGWFDNNNLPELLQKAELCCFPSHAEAFAIAPLEAMSVGKPVIFMNNGPGPEVIIDGNSGFLCNSKDPKDIAAKIEYIFQNPNIAEKVGMSARLRVITFFNVENWVHQNIDFYTQAIISYTSKRSTNKR